MYYLYAHYTSMDAVDEHGASTITDSLYCVRVGHEVQEYLTDSMRWYMLLDAGGGSS